WRSPCRGRGRGRSPLALSSFPLLCVLCVLCGEFFSSSPLLRVSSSVPSVPPWCRILFFASRGVLADPSRREVSFVPKRHPFSRNQACDHERSPSSRCSTFHRRARRSPCGRRVRRGGACRSR